VICFAVDLLPSTILQLFQLERHGGLVVFLVSFLTDVYLLIWHLAACSDAFEIIFASSYLLKKQMLSVQ
jgi:hypothetical protein